jgi:hypothetical protein
LRRRTSSYTNLHTSNRTQNPKIKINCRETETLKNAIFNLKRLELFLQHAKPLSNTRDVQKFADNFDGRYYARNTNRRVACPPTSDQCLKPHAAAAAVLMHHVIDVTSGRGQVLLVVVFCFETHICDANAVLTYAPLIVCHIVHVDGALLWALNSSITTTTQFPVIKPEVTSETLLSNSVTIKVINIWPNTSKFGRLLRDLIVTLSPSIMH